MIWGSARGFFYLYFSVVIGWLAALLTFVALGSQAAASQLPGGGWPLIIFWIAFVLAALVSTQASHFGSRVSLLKWIPLCVAVTGAAAAFAVLGL
ncbi:MAG TPA: hypothetical protein VGV88_03725 [Candidatus Dormibacteraeota bacterium]|nr:hypothetical protein [Candidatus Dormibacteraeota bacterium]